MEKIERRDDYTVHERLFFGLPVWSGGEKTGGAFHQYLHPNSVSKYQPIKRREVRVKAFLRRLFVTSDNFFHHIR